MTEHIILKGTYFNVGKALGEHTKQAVRTILGDFKQSSFFAKVSSFIKTPEGARILKTFKDTVKSHCRPYLEELRGTAEGAGVDVEELFIFNCDSEFAAVLEDYPQGSHGVGYASLYDGCTNISMETKDGQLYLAHTEDIGPVARDLGVMLSVEICGEDGVMLEAWTDYNVPGVLGGSKFSFNSHGIMYGANNVYQEGVNINGIPRKFICRSMLSVKDTAQARQILGTAPGIATAYSFHYLQKTTDGVDNTVIEVAGTSEGSRVSVFNPTGYYHHCNMFQHLHYSCHPEESSVHRAAVISQYVNRGQTDAKRHLLAAISNRQDVKFPVHRNGVLPDYLATGATGIFDVQAGTLEVYTEVPESSQPTHVFNVPSSHT